MSDKTKPTKSTHEIVVLIEKKLLFFQDVIQKTILHVKKNKILDIIGVSEVNVCMNSLFELSKKIKDINNVSTSSNADNIINILQQVNNELSSLIKLVGTDSFEDLLWICFGNNSVNSYAISDMDKHKFELLKKYFHPTSYKLLCVKNEKKDIKDDSPLNEKSKNLDSVDVGIKMKPFYLKVYGMQLIIHNHQQQKSLIITGIIDDIMIDFLNNKYVNLKCQAINENIPQSIEFQGDAFARFMHSLNLKDYLIFEPHEIYSKYAGYLSNLNSLSQKTITQVVKDFISSDLFIKRNTIIQLLIKIDKCDNQYLAYLLYDLLSNDTNGIIDTQEQTTLFDSFPWTIKQYFKDAMKNTVQYTSDLSNFDIQKIPLEQQICLLKVDDSVKEKATQKLKEIKAKSEDSGSKARQYLDGLLKIPFNIYRREPILNIMATIKSQFINLLQTSNVTNNPIKENYTSLEILRYIKNIKGLPNKKETPESVNVLSDDFIKHKLDNMSCSELKTMAIKINELIKTNNFKWKRLKLTNQPMSNRKEDIMNFVNGNMSISSTLFGMPNVISTTPFLEIEQKYGEINNYMLNVKHILDKSVYGHDKAKKQIEIIIGQWINGKQDGYCFGFEGPPGCGKTTLAKKGLADCLKDDSGISRPFAMIQMGGDANGSSLHGHNYTYVGSTWGSIVQILIDKKCMNPIIFIDEIDKISKTEHGKEIIGILTHLLDPSQNDSFQDKYFSGINLDLSKALFILSYNDADAIDKILLDRVHRVKFKSLSLEEKLVISTTHLLPEIYNKMGLCDMIYFSDEVLKFIIDEYTSEPGVRKLKELLFEIVGEINLTILKNFNTQYEIPIHISIKDVKTIYLKDKHESLIRKVSNKKEIGFINGMYATSLGTGGTLPIHAKFFPCDKFLDLKLTGMQQDVMRESMHVSLTVAWNITCLERQTKLRHIYDTDNNRYGINIHTGDGAVSKDGPSGGCAITCALYSLLNDIPIKPEFGITGEIQMSGEVTAIGGLNYKILGSLKSNVKSFIFPKENEKDFHEFFEKYKDADILKGIQFYPVSTVVEALDLILDK